jgi:hypothetical protein
VIVVDEFNRRKRETPRYQVLKALAMARAKGWALGFEDASIELDGDSWVPHDDRPLGLIGLILVAHGVRALNADDAPFTCCVRFLRVSQVWVDGLYAGWRLTLAHGSRGTEAACADYRAGFELGAECRFMATVVCRDCGTRRFKGDDCGCGS